MKLPRQFTFFIALAFAFTLLRADSAHAQDSPSVIIGEARIGETNAPLNEFLEIYNRSEKTVDISGWKLRKKTASGAISSIASIDTCVFLPPKKHFLWAHGKGRFAENADKVTGTAAGFLSKSNTFEITDSNDIIQDSLVWGDVQHDNESAERNLETLESVFISTPSPTGHEYTCEQPAIEAPTEKLTNNPTKDTLDSIPQANTIRINEILPHPSDTEEFIELFNFGKTDVDLKGWSLHDASKTGKYTFKESSIIEGQSYLTLLRSAFSFALNDTNETITLSDPKNAPVDSVGYAKSRKDASYGFSPLGWRWSETATPDATNIFGSPPKAKTTVAKEAYRNTPVEFTAKNADDDTEYKYLWDFGDGRTSRLANALHTYSKTGTYRVTLTVSDAIESLMKEFAIKIKRLPKIKLSITGISPDPAGTDTGNEWVSIRNDSKKKVDLSDWSIATGSTKETLTNHPFRQNLTLKPAEETVITNELSAFTLPNKNGYIELRQPNKKVSDALQYTKPESIGEGSVYHRSSDASWSWTEDESPTDSNEEKTSQVSEGTVGKTDGTVIETEEKQEQTPSIMTTNDIIDAIDTLPTDELTILRTQIEAKMKMLAIEQEGIYNKVASHAEPHPNAITDVTTDSSLLSKEPLISHEPADSDTEIVRYMNRTIGLFLRNR